MTVVTFSLCPQVPAAHPCRTGRSTDPGARWKPVSANMEGAVRPRVGGLEKARLQEGRATPACLQLHPKGPWAGLLVASGAALLTLRL